MIRITRLNNSEVVVNANLIEFVEATPDTVITLANDRRIIVRESVDDVMRQVVEFLRTVYAPPGEQKPRSAPADHGDSNCNPQSPGG